MGERWSNSVIFCYGVTFILSQYCSRFQILPLQKSTWASGAGRLGMAAGFGGQLEEEVSAAAEAS